MVLKRPYLQMVEIQKMALHWLLFGMLTFLSLCFFQWVYNYIILSANNNKLPPGPLGLPILGNLHNLLLSPAHQCLARLSTKYGSVMTVKFGNVNTIVVSSKEVAKEVFTTYDHVFASRPGLICGGYLSYGRKNISTSEYGAHWRQMRKIAITELFSPRRIREFKAMREQEVSLLLKSIAEDSSSGAINMNHKLGISTLNSITRMALGNKAFGSEQDRILSILLDVIHVTCSVNIGDFLPALSWLDTNTTSMKRVHARMDQILQKLIDDRTASDDLIGIMISHGLDHDCIKAVLIDVIGGGTDTSALEIEWALSELIRNPSCLTKAQAEIDEVVGRDRAVLESDIENLHYLQAIVKETFRLHPIVPLLLPHYATQDCTFMGYRVPSGTWLLVNVWSMGRDPNTWESPCQFKPERFMGSSIDFKGRDFDLIPFGSGRRMCIAMGLGSSTIQLILANLIHSFSWRIEGDLNMEEAKGILAKKKKPLVAYAMPR